MQIQLFNTDTATEGEWQAAFALEAQFHAEFNPEDAPLQFDEFQRTWRNVLSNGQMMRWLVLDGGRAVARGHVWLSHDENTHVAKFHLYVAPDERRHGLARQLLQPMVEAAQREDRRLMQTWTESIVPAGERFMQRLGAKAALENRESQLVLAEVDRALLRRWIDGAQERAQGFHLDLIEDTFPEADLAAIGHVFGAMNDAPKGELDIEAETWTPARLRDWEAMMAARGRRRWTLLARETGSGTVVGLTELIMDPQRPESLYQGFTGVLPAYRQRGLGRWLKADMLERILGAWPQAERIRTGNAEANRAMLNINEALGFKPHLVETEWQVEVARVGTYVSVPMTPIEA